ncbi:hypothetical protein Tco_0259530, partial [Tanacetum coccineum]
MVNDSGPPLDHRWTTGQQLVNGGGPPPDHRSTVVDLQSTARPGWVV